MGESFSSASFQTQASAPVSPRINSAPLSATPLRWQSRVSLPIPSGNRTTGSSTMLGQVPGDPHGVRNARGASRVTARGSVRAYRPPQSREAQERRDLLAAAVTRRLPLAPVRPDFRQRNNTTHTTDSTNTTAESQAVTARVDPIIDRIPVSDFLTSILANSLRECSGYDTVATFAKSNYPHLAQRCNLTPRFLQQGSTDTLEPPSPLRMDEVLQRLVTYHIARTEVANLQPPDWEGYMQLAIELAWVETGMMVFGFAGDIPQRIWEQGQDYGGSGEAGRYIEEDVRMKLEDLVWRDVERRYMRG